jgi:hypothetical protein
LLISSKTGLFALSRGQNVGKTWAKHGQKYGLSVAPGSFWIVDFYISQTSYPIPGIGAWNLIIGFSFIAVGFSLATKWR